MMKSAPTPMAVLDHGEGARVWDVDGTRVPRLPRRHRRQRARARAPGVRGCRGRPGRELAHVSQLLRHRAAARARRAAHPAERRRPGVLRQLRRRGDRGGDQARAAHRQAAHPVARGLVPRPHDGLARRSPASRRCRQPFLPLLPGVEQIDATIEALERALAAGDVAALVRRADQGRGRRRRPARRATSPRPARLTQRARRAADPRRDPDRRRPHGGLVRVPARRRHRPRRDRASRRASAADSRSARSSPSAPRATCSRAGHHGSTFGGNPLATATANAVLGEIERAGLVENARAARRPAARSRRSARPLITDIQGRGLLHRRRARRAGRPPRRRARPSTRGLIVNAATDSRIRLAPPLIIGDAEIAEFLDAVHRIALEKAIA